MFRLGLSLHWDLTDRTGGHQATLRAALLTEKLLGISGRPDLEAGEVLAISNWAKHAPPPGATTMPSMPGCREGALTVVALEEFR